MGETPEPDEPDGLAWLSEAAASIGLDLAPVEPDIGIDAYVGIPGEKPVATRVTRRSFVSAHDVHRMISHREEASDQKEVMRIVVADRITAEAKNELRRAGWGWLDLRGHLRLRAKGLLVDSTLAPLRQGQRSLQPFAGRVGIEVAAAVLLEPEQALGVRQLASMLGRAPSSVSAAVAALRQARLLDDTGKPRSPELFWELASAWKPKHVRVKAAPAPADDVAVLKALRVNIDELTTAGWALSDVRAAVAYGAPLAIRDDQQPDFYVPDERVMRRAVQLLGEPAGRADGAVTLRVAPSSIVCARREDPTKHDWNRTDEYWPLAQPLFVALDLARDPGRGRQVLADWTPPEPWHRVW